MIAIISRSVIIIAIAGGVKIVRPFNRCCCCVRVTSRRLRWLNRKRRSSGCRAGNNVASDPPRRRRGLGSLGWSPPLLLPRWRRRTRRVGGIRSRRWLAAAQNWRRRFRVIIRLNCKLLLLRRGRTTTPFHMLGETYWSMIVIIWCRHGEDLPAQYF